MSGTATRHAKRTFVDFVPQMRDKFLPWDNDTYIGTQIRSIQALVSRRHVWCGEMALAKAVLTDGIRIFLTKRASIDQQDARSRREFYETCQWIWSKNGDGLFSFVHICELLGLDPSCVRKWLTSR